MREFILVLDYDTKIIRNLRATWIQPQTMSGGWMLCYEDDEYERGIIYRSQDKALLMKLQGRMIEAYSAGKEKIQL
ncbi:MAG: hypothetical protein HFJ30_10105 [Clostridia bacterium]|jgi:hypothetical protein|nr:hypothetical protein [Clostridia bacterium]